MKITQQNRRTILKAMLAANCAAVSGMPLTTRANNALEIIPVNERITLVRGAGSNVTVFAGPDGLCLVDSGSKQHAVELLQLVRELGQGPINCLFNTHWHEDHTGGNELFREAGASIIAHENTRLWLDADFFVEWRQWGHKPRPEAALPDQTFYVSGEKNLGTELVQYIHVPQAHTDGDIFLFFPDSNVMVTGGLLSNYTYPTPDIATGGWIGGLLEANEKMLAMANDNTLLIPDTGPVLKKTDLQAQYDMLTDIYQKMKALAQQGFSGADMLAEGVTSEYDNIWGDPKQFVIETYRGMWAHTSDMGGFI